MQYITFTREDTPGTMAAAVVDHLPEVGDPMPCGLCPGRTVLEVAPWPPTGEQAAPEIYGYATWKIHLDGLIFAYLAIAEPEAELL